MSSNNEELTFPEQASTIKKGDYFMISDHPCECVDVSISKTGKHGGCKCHFVGKDIFTGTKHTIIYSSKDKIDVPVVKKDEYMLINIEENDNYVSLMTLDGSLTRDDIFINDDEMRQNIFAEFKTGKTIVCIVLSSMNKSKIINYRIDKKE